MAELRRLAEHCNYGDTLDTTLRDSLVWGINDAGIQKKLLQENDPLILTRALIVAQGAETADKNLKEMKAPPQQPGWRESEIEAYSNDREKVCKVV